MRGLILSLFVLEVMTLVMLNNFYLAGIPFRSFIVLCAAMLVMLESTDYFTDLKLLNISYVLLAMTGLIVSLYNGSEGSEIFSGMVRLLQSYLFIVTCYYLMKNYGYKGIVYPVLLFAIASAFIGFLQFLDISFAWSIRDMLGGLQNTKISEQLTAEFIEGRSRPPGLTLYAITQSYLLLTAIALALFTYIKLTMEGKSSFWLLVVLAILFLGTVACETRSAIGAAAIMIFLTFLRLKTIPTIILSVCLVAVFAVIKSYKSSPADSDSRITSFEDQSAKGRLTLYKFGLELALKKPLGYGYGFSSKEIAVEYFANERNYYNYGLKEKAQYLVEIHNSVLSMLHIYGLIGLLILFYYITSLAKVSWFFIVVILSYLLHAMFHNAGIMMNDLFIDAVIAIILYYMYNMGNQAVSSANVYAQGYHPSH